MRIVIRNYYNIMKYLLKTVILGISIFAILNSGYISGQDEEEENETSIFQRSDPEDFEPAKQFKDPRQLLHSIAPFVIVKRTPYLEELGYYPCSDCHGEDQPPNPKIRSLEEDHESINLVHGQGRFWCLTCHSEEDRDHLVDLKGQPVSFDDAYLVCGQCHFQRQKDFLYGAHGKRKGNWQGSKVLYNCTECHNPHVPQIPSRKPVSTPKVRTGLIKIMPKKHTTKPPWSQNID